MLLRFTLLVLTQFADSLAVGKIKDHSELRKLLENTVNLTADPCDNFYQFACGAADETGSSYVQESKQAAERVIKEALESSEKSPSSAIENAKLAYRLCLQSGNDSLEHAQFLTDTYSFPMVNGGNMRYDFTRLLAEMRGFPFFNIDTERGSTLHIDIRFATYQKRAYYTEPRLKAKYRSYMIAKTRLLVGDYESLGYSRESPIDQQQLEKDVDDVIALEERFMTLYMRKMHSEIEPVQFSNLSKIFPQVDWPRFFKAPHPDKVYPEPAWAGNFGYTSSSDVDTFFTSNPSFNVRSEYFKGLSEIIQSIDPVIKIDSEDRMGSNTAVLLNFLMHRLSEDYSHSFDDRYRALVEKYLGGKNESYEERQAGCLNAVNNFLPQVTAALYLNKTGFPEKSKYEAEKLFATVRDQFIDTVNKTDWLTEDTKALTITKLTTVKVYIGYEDFVRNETELHHLYNSDMSSVKTYSGMKFALLFIKDDRDFFRFLNGILPRMTTVHEIAARYDTDSHYIEIQSGFLNSRYFSSSHPPAYNYGSLATVMAHELMHVFLDKVESVFNEEERREFVSRLNAIGKQRAQSFIPSFNASLSGVNTLNEDMADEGEVAMALKVFQALAVPNAMESLFQIHDRNFTDDQLFFLGVARFHCDKRSLDDLDWHSPSENRLNFMLRNRPEFAKAFNCPIDSRMNPQTKANIF